MQFTFDKSILPAIQAAMESSGKTILSNVMLELTGNDLAISCTDSKTFYSTIAKVEGKADGKCLVPVSKLAEVIGSLKAEPIDFTLAENKCSLKQGKSRAMSIRTMDTSGFPESPKLSAVSEFVLPAHIISDIVQKVAYAASTDESRYFMTGVFVEIEGKTLKAVATDGRRLAVIEYPLDTPDVKGIIVPVKILSLIAKRAKGNINISFDGKFISAEFDDTIITSVCIDGQFPKYQKVIPEKQSYKFISDRKDMLDGINRVGLFTDSKSRRMFLEVKESSLILYSDDNELGSAKEELPTDHNGSYIKIALNSGFIIDCLKASDEEKVIIEYTSASKALTVTDGSGILNVLMPMQVE